MDNRYNGWRNRETWLVNLWFDGTFNASDTAHSIRETVTEHVDSQIGTVLKHFNNSHPCGMGHSNGHRRGREGDQGQSPMTYLILAAAYLALSIPLALFLGAFIKTGDR